MKNLIIAIVLLCFISLTSQLHESRLRHQGKLINNSGGPGCDNGYCWDSCGFLTWCHTSWNDKGAGSNAGIFCNDGNATACPNIENDEMRCIDTCSIEILPFSWDKEYSSSQFS